MCQYFLYFLSFFFKQKPENLVVLLELKWTIKQNAYNFVKCPFYFFDNANDSLLSLC